MSATRKHLLSLSMSSLLCFNSLGYSIIAEERQEPEEQTGSEKATAEIFVEQEEPDVFESLLSSENLSEEESEDTVVTSSDTDINIDDENLNIKENFEFEETVQYKEETDSDLFVSGDYSYTVSDGIATIMKYKGSDTSLEVPSEFDGYPVKIIDESAFSFCSSLVSVKLPEGITDIGEGAFYYCHYLTDVVIPYGVTSIEKGVFQDCHNLKTISIPEGITSVPDFAFYNCEKLVSASLPKSLTSIGASAFKYCSSLSEITIPEGVVNIGQGAFTWCSSLTSVTLPDGITNISNSLFYNCTNLKTVTFSEKVTSIEDCAFCGCTSLTDVMLPEGLTSIGYEAFCDCTSFSKITIPESAVIIGERAFKCDQLKTAGPIGSGSDIEFGWKTVIPKNAFCYCGNLTNVIIPDGIKIIEGASFYQCENLTNIVIPSGVKTIGSSVFYECSNLTTITIPKSLTGIEDYAFDTCTGLTTVNYMGTKSQWETLLDHIGSNNESLINAPNIIFSSSDIPAEFADVTDPSDFYYDYVYDMAEKGVVQGYDDGTFRPYNDCNRAAVVTFLWRLMGKPEPAGTATFSDLTGNEDFDKAISWASEEGITTGWKEDNTFRPWVTCNRAAVMTFLWRAAGKPEPQEAATFSDMTDNTDFNKAISWAAENGITTGWDDNTFRPWRTCNRLAIVSFLARYDGLINKK